MIPPTCTCGAAFTTDANPCKIHGLIGKDGYERASLLRQTSEDVVLLNDLLAAVVGRIDGHSKEWGNAKSAGEEKVMTRTEGKIREGRKISLMIKKIIKQSS